MYLFSKNESLKYFYIYIDIVYLFLIAGISITIFLNFKAVIIQNYEQDNLASTYSIKNEIEERMEIFNITLATSQSIEAALTNRADLSKYIEAVYRVNPDGVIAEIVYPAKLKSYEQLDIKNLSISGPTQDQSVITTSNLTGKYIYKLYSHKNDKDYILEISTDIFMPRYSIKKGLFMLIDKLDNQKILKSTQNLPNSEINLDTPEIVIKGEKYRYKEFQLVTPYLSGVYVYPYEETNRIADISQTYFFTVIALLLFFIIIRNYIILKYSYAILKRFQKIIVKSTNHPITLNSRFEEWQDIESAYNLHISKINNEISDLESELEHKKNIEEGIISGEKKFKLLIEQMNEGVVLCDGYDNIVNVNSEFLKFIGKDKSSNYK